MSINVNVGNLIPADVVEVGQEISADQLAAITSAVGASGSNPFALQSHTHTIANVTGLQTAIDGKASLVHTHSIVDITNLETTLSSKAGIIHSHVINEIEGLQLELDGKALLIHSHAIADVTGLQTALDGKAGVSHTHTIANVTGLQTALDGKTDDSEFNSLEGRVDTLENNTASSVFPNGITTSLIKNILNEEIVVDAYNDAGAGTHHYHKFNPIDGRFYLAPNGGGLVFPDATIQDTASYSKAQSDAHLDTVATWVDTKADWGHTHVIADVTGLQTALDSKMAVTQSWLEFDIGRTFTITDGVLTWDNASTLSHPMSGSNAGNFVFNKKVNFTPVSGVAGLNIGIGGTSTASTTNGDIWIVTGGTNLNFRDGNGAWRIVAVANTLNTFSSPQVIDTTSTTTALRVTQKGTGNAFVVEDSTTPDSTPFIINATGQTIIGRTTAPNSSIGLSVGNGIHVESGTGTTTAIQIIGNIDAASQQTNANTTSISSEYTDEWQVIINGQLAYIPFRR